MLKHIKKKTVNHFKLPENTIENFDKISQPDKDSINNVLAELKYKDVKNKHAFLLMESGEVLRTFFFNDNGNVCTIPLANPVLIYFHIAQVNLSNIYSTKKELLGLFHQKDQVEVTETSLKLFYDFFGITSSFVTLLMTALEAFVNQNIKDDTKYSKSEQNKFTKVYDSDQIQRWLSLEEKIEKILNKDFNKSFFKSYPTRYIHITNLKELRDNIVHTKSGNLFDNYTELYKKSLNFKYAETIEAVRDFINFYENNLIEACPCGVDF